MTYWKQKQLKARRRFIISETIESLSFLGTIAILFYLLIL